MVANLLRILAEDEPHLLVKEAMNKDFVTVLPSEMLESAFQRLQTCERRSLLVVEDGKVLGILTMETLGEFLVLQPVLKAKANQKVAA